MKTDGKKKNSNVIFDAADIVKKEKIRLIREILELYFTTTPPNTKRQYWYGEVFDNLYEKDILELRITLSVYQKTRNKKHI